MFRQPKKHAASTSSKGTPTGGGVLPSAVLPISWHISGDHYTFFNKPIASYIEYGHKRLKLILFGYFGSPEEYPTFNNFSGFELVSEDWTFVTYDQIGTTINDEFIQSVKQDVEHCEYFREYLIFLKKYKGLNCIFLSASTDDAPDTAKINISWYGETIIEGLEMPSSEDDILGTCEGE